MYDDVISDDHSRIDAHSGIDDAVASDLHTITYIDMFIDLCMVTDHSLSADVCKIPDIDLLADSGSPAYLAAASAMPLV
jgi:hypothetical protein